MTHTGFKPMQDMINEQVKEKIVAGYSDERIFQDYLYVDATASVLVMVSKAIHG